MESTGSTDIRAEALRNATEGRRANSQYARAAGLLGVEKRFRAFAEGAEEPTLRQERFDEIVARWEQVQSPSLD